VGADTEGAVGAKNITAVIASFRPGKRFRTVWGGDVIVFKKAWPSRSEGQLTAASCTSHGDELAGSPP